MSDTFNTNNEFDSIWIPPETLEDLKATHEVGKIPDPGSHNSSGIRAIMNRNATGGIGQYKTSFDTMGSALSGMNDAIVSDDGDEYADARDSYLEALATVIARSGVNMSPIVIRPLPAVDYQGNTRFPGLEVSAVIGNSQGLPLAASWSSSSCSGGYGLLFNRLRELIINGIAEDPEFGRELEKFILERNSNGDK